MLAILLASTGIVTFTANSKKQEKSFGHYFVEKNNSNNDVTIIASVDNNSLLLKETEHLEFNFEINWNSIFSFTHHFLEVTEKSFCFLNYNKVFTSTQNLPLYDLFCNWKLHIS